MFGKVILAAVVTAFVAVYGVPAWAAEMSAANLETPGVTKGEILIGEPAAFSGPSAGLGVEMWRGLQAAVEETNARGGIYGRQLRVVLADDGYEPARAAGAVELLVERDKVFATGWSVGTPTMVKALPVILKFHDSQSLFHFSNFTGAQAQREDPYRIAVFNIRASYRDETKAMVDAFVQMGRKKIGMFIQDDAYGASGLDGTKRALQAHGLDVVAVARYTRGQKYGEDYSAQVKALQDAGVDAVISIGAYQACGGFIRDARLGGWNVPIHNVSFVGADQMLELLRVTEKETGKTVTQNLIVTQVVPHYNDTSLRIVSEYRNAIDKYSPTVPARVNGGPYQGQYKPTQTYTFGSLEGYISTRAFIAILEKTGPNLDRKAFYQTANSMGQFDIGLGVPLRFSADRNQALDKVWFTYAMEDGWRSTDNIAQQVK